MPRLDEFSAWVTIDGTEAVEYGATPLGNTVTCWIPSDAGKQFKVVWNDSLVKTPTRGEASIDGFAYVPRYIENRIRNKATLGGVRDSEHSIRPLEFGKINLTDDDIYLDSGASQLGEIKIVIHRVAYAPYSPSSPPNRRSRGHAATPYLYHERSKKGFGHQVNLGPRRNVGQAKVSDVRRSSFEKPTGMPVAIFIFKYRPIEVLMADGIVPCTAPQMIISQLPTKTEDIAFIKTEDGTGDHVRTETFIVVDDDEEVKRTVTAVDTPVSSSLDSLLLRIGRFAPLEPPTRFGRAFARALKDSCDPNLQSRPVEMRFQAPHIFAC